jgi:hypothetical protein
MCGINASETTERKLVKIKIVLTVEIEIVETFPPTSFFGKLLHLKKRVKKFVSGTFELITNGEANIGHSLTFPVWNSQNLKKFTIEECVLRSESTGLVGEVPLYCRTEGFWRNCFSFEAAKSHLQNEIAPRLKKNGFELLPDIKFLDHPSKPKENW